MTQPTPGTDLLAYSIGGPLAKIAQSPEAYVDRRFPATKDDLDSVALVVRERPHLNTEDAVGKLLDVFTWHRLNSIAYVRDLVDIHGLDRVTLVLDFLFESGMHAHREPNPGLEAISQKPYDPTAGVKELLELLVEIDDLNTGIEFSPVILDNLAQRAGGVKALMGLSGYELVKILRSEDDFDGAEFPLDTSLTNERDLLTEDINNDDPADVHLRLQEPARHGSRW